MCGVDSSRAEIYSPKVSPSLLRRLDLSFHFFPNAMPLNFANMPGAGGGNALVLARGAHPIEAIGAAIVLATMVPAFVPVAGAANNFFFQFALIYWLLLPILVADPELTLPSRATPSWSR